MSGHSCVELASTEVDCKNIRDLCVIIMQSPYLPGRACLDRVSSQSYMDDLCL